LNIFEFLSFFGAIGIMLRFWYAKWRLKAKLEEIFEWEIMKAKE
jgi:hypothetical protein